MLLFLMFNSNNNLSKSKNIKAHFSGRNVVKKETNIVHKDAVNLESIIFQLKQNEQLQQTKIKYLEEEIARLNMLIQKKNMEMYSRRSEKLQNLEVNSIQLSFFDEPKEPEEEEVSSENNAVEKPKVNEKPKVKRNAGRKPIDPNLKRVDVIHDIPVSERSCSCCGEEKTYMSEDVSEKIAMIPAQLFVNRHIRKKYACRKCQEGVQIAPLEPALVPKCTAEPSLLAHVIISKYKDHLPLYRQEEILDRIGIPLNNNTLCNWTLKVAEALEPLYEHILSKVKQSKYIQADETTLTVMGYRTPDKQWHRIGNCYMWLYKTGNDNFMYYKYERSRSGDHPVSVLRGYRGYLQTDGYAGYNKVIANKEIISVRCMAHARRKFVDIIKCLGNKSSYGLSHKVVALMAQLYKIEKECKEEKLSVNKIYQIRQQESKPIMEELKKLLEESKPVLVSSSLLGKAVNYSLNNWDGLYRYLSDGCLHIDNNLSEQCMKSYAVGRKNWLFHQNDRGAKAGAILFSIIWTAQAHKVNLQNYLEFLIKKFPTVSNLDEVLPSAYLSTLQVNSKSS